MKLISTNQLVSTVDEDVCLQARLTVIDKVVSSSQGQTRIRLSDSFGDLDTTILANTLAGQWLYMLSEPGDIAVEVVGQTLVCKDGVRLTVKELYAIDASHVINAARLMPTSWVPVGAKDAWGSLIDFIDNLESQNLRDFINAVLMDEKIGAPFAQSRASGENHRSFIGGLVVHSMEVATLAGAIADTLHCQLLDKELTQVAALLHDLGKINTVGTENPRPMPPKLFKHETQSLLLLAPHLDRLQSQAPELCWVLTHLLERLATDNSALRSHFIGEDIVRYADYLSAANDIGKGMTNFLGLCGYATKHPMRLKQAA